MSRIGKHNEISMTEYEPKIRIRTLSNYGNMIEIDPSISIQRYCRSGTEMLRMAQVYLTERNHENAYILYMKYMTLFLEKIRMHPEFHNIKSEIKAINKRIKEEVMPTSEKLRAKILDHYQREYEQFLAHREAEKARELERERDRERQKQISAAATFIPANLHVQIDSTVQPSAPDLNLLDQVVYPNDFPTSSSRSHLPNSGLLLVGDTEKESFKSSISTKPIIDRSQKPQYCRSDSLLEGSLRSVVIPQNTMEVFLHLAQSNTSKNVETCGILAGHLQQNRFYITHVIVPKQQGTADSCNTMHEEEIFDVQDQKNLITLGWIHTHPSQTAFLSSVDLHTHCSYQMMMSEAIAIVCAPKYQTTGFFNLTQNYGLDYIAQCRQTGFHPHPNDPPLFMEAQHIQIDSHTQIEVVDLRR
ncbi:STAM-binding protein [Teleopsis dalmanni]|uniref:STAM-binding protein n=1 Tax=Teleopsis dalmanni TaxID=139649 RepID=UPI0018CF3590|nr:STAM-binding protein [Teleopsis dalmanni]